MMIAAFFNPHILVFVCFFNKTQGFLFPQFLCTRMSHSPSVRLHPFLLIYLDNV